ncbi:MAG: LysR family transcriptional regulator [Ruminococcaceae bacterium]|nr:LysR family transcriptional regulator [Oscillospiraceae bacterium]
MNTTQVKCFLALAETLNFTKAAARLYISQPGLSRQISSLERELNTQLFIRSQKGVSLTPAGALLAGELAQLHDAQLQLLRRVQTVGQGYTGELNLGLLEGQWMGAELTEVFRRFMKKHPNIDLRISKGSFGELRRLLMEGRIDAAFTIRFDIDDMEGVDHLVYDPDTAVFAVSRRLPLGQKENIGLEDMMQETLLMISPEDCRTGYEQSLSHFRTAASGPITIREAPNLTTMMLWIELGLGVGVINHRSSIASNPDIRLIHEIPLGDASTCLVWRKENSNPAITHFIDILKSQ